MDLSFLIWAWILIAPMVLFSVLSMMKKAVALERVPPEMARHSLHIVRTQGLSRRRVLA